MTLGQLRKLIEGLPDETPVYLGSKSTDTLDPDVNMFAVGYVTKGVYTMRLSTNPNDKVHTGLVVQT